jgi:long-chain fatty acid transport protein
LELPQEVGLGAAYEFYKVGLLLETNVKWINWSDAEGYGDFDWDDQWVFAVGAQWEAIDNIFLRVGYNYAVNPVEDNDGWNGTFAPLPVDTVNVQGKSVPRYAFETLRVQGFPAIVEHHFTAGVGYEFGEKLILSLSYMHAFENTLSESGTAPDGTPAEIESELYEDSISFSFSYRF